MDLFKRWFTGSTRYDAAQISNARERVADATGDAEQELSQVQLAHILNLTRQAEANEGIIREVVNQIDIYTVGDGIRAQSASADESANDAFDAYFERWARSRVDSSGRFTLARCSSLVCRALLVDGEIYAVKQLNSRGAPELHFFEAHRVADTSREPPESGWHQGIQFRNGKPAAYRFVLDDGRAQDFPAESVIHVFEAHRPTDIHGVSPFQHALREIQDAKELLALVKKKGKLQETIAIAVTGNRFAGQGSTAGLVDVSDAPATDPDALSSRSDPDALYRITGAKALLLQEGETAQSFAANSPSPEFFQAYEKLQKIALNGTLPYEFVVDPSAVGGAGVRLVVGKAARFFDRMQALVISEFLMPVRKFVIGSAIVAGKLPAVEDWTEAEWSVPKSVTVDAGREREQDRADVLNGFSTLSDYYAVRGKDFRRDLKLWARDARAIRAAEKQAGEQFPYHTAAAASPVPAPSTPSAVS